MESLTPLNVAEAAPRAVLAASAYAALLPSTRVLSVLLVSPDCDSANLASTFAVSAKLVALSLFAKTLAQSSSLQSLSSPKRAVLK
jgi:hypothetical protein